MVWHFLFTWTWQPCSRHAAAPRFQCNLLFSVVCRHVTSLGHQEGQSFLRGGQIFWTMSNSFKRCPTHFSRGGKIFSRGCFAPPGYGPGCVCVCRALSLSALYSVRDVWRALPSSRVTAYGTVVEISASVQNPRFLCNQVIQNYELKIVHNCLDMTVTSLMYDCKYINKFVLLPRRSAVGS